MSTVFADITMSLDGFIAGPNDDLDNPMGEGGEELHDWIINLKAWREPHGLEGGDTGVDSDLWANTIQRPGAIIVGRRMYDLAQGWGERPPFGMPVFVLTHRAEPPLSREGGTTYTFVTDGIESALAQAKMAADGKDVGVWGGASIIQQYLAAGLLDELQFHIAARLLGNGRRLFDANAAQMAIEPVKVVGSPLVTHVYYRLNHA